MTEGYEDLLEEVKRLKELLALRGQHLTKCPAYKVIGRFGSRSGLRWQPGDERRCSEDCGLGSALGLSRQGGE